MVMDVVIIMVIALEMNGILVLVWCAPMVRILIMEDEISPVEVIKILFKVVIIFETIVIMVIFWHALMVRY